VGAWNGLTQALSSMIAIKKRINRDGVRFIGAYCTLRETGRGSLYNDERFSRA
jgi:hypothetical protein